VLKTNKHTKTKKRRLMSTERNKAEACCIKETKKHKQKDLD